MTLTDRVTGFNLPNLQTEEKVVKILDAALGKEFYLRKISKEQQIDTYFWNAGYFNLDRVAIFQTATTEEKQEILKLCSQGLLAETYLVEKAGVGYMAKMTLLAETTEERMLYALFSADEATHLAQISQFSPKISLQNNGFCQFLANFLETGNKAALIFIVQIVLEGWGLTHYRRLAQYCLDPNLTQIYTGFLQAEARHHAMGVTSFVPYRQCVDTQDTIIQALSIFLHLVQIGPVGVVSAIEQVKGGLSMVERIKVFEELDTENHSHQRLQILRNLIYQSGYVQVEKQLQTNQLFHPFSPEECAKLMTS
jgi:hypothetical protein